MTIEDLVFVGFNSRIAALDRRSGKLLWKWRCPKGTGFVALLVDGDRLIASVGGYTYCLDPATGEELWSNPLQGFGIGVPSLATCRASSSHSLLGMARSMETQRKTQSDSPT